MTALGCYMHSQRLFGFPGLSRESLFPNDKKALDARILLLLMRQILPVFMITFCAPQLVDAQDDPYRDQRSPESRAKMNAGWHGPRWRGYV